MPNYRRIFVPGGCWFFTVNLADRRSRLLTEHIEALREAVARVRRDRPFDIDAWVVLPNHMHAVWTLPSEDSDFPTRWRLIKTFFAKALPTNEWRSHVHMARAERGIWQRRYWEHLIRDERDYAHHIDYCWFNPVKHGLVADVEDWPFSSFHRDHRDNPRPGDLAQFEAALAAHACLGGYGEREERAGPVGRISLPTGARPECGRAGKTRESER
jgi:putative transposase